MRRLPAMFLAVAVALAALAVPAATASAHEISVLEPGPAAIDVGDGSTTRLVHATLAAASDTLRVSVHVANEPIEALLLVPDASPERQASSREQPRLELIGAHAVHPTRYRDDVTGVAYRSVARVSLGRGAVDIVIRRGGAPSRVALLVGADLDVSFRADHPTRTPRTLLRLQQWAATPASGSPTARSADHSSARAWYAAGLAIVALLIAAWWVRAGKVRSRERGVERSRGE